MVKRSIGAVALIKRSFFQGSGRTQPGTFYSEGEVCASKSQPHSLPRDTERGALSEQLVSGPAAE